MIQADVASEFSTPVDPLQWAAGTPVTLLAGAAASFMYDVVAIDAIRLQAGGASAASEAEVYFHFGE